MAVEGAPKEHLDGEDKPDLGSDDITGVRDFTRRYGYLESDGNGHLRDSAGVLWEPIDPTSITSTLEHGLRRVENPQVPDAPPVENT